MSPVKVLKVGSFPGGAVKPKAFVRGGTLQTVEDKAAKTGAHWQDDRFSGLLREK